jgi:RND family efflux transporter MFP subunit
MTTMPPNPSSTPLRRTAAVTLPPAANETPASVAPVRETPAATAPEHRRGFPTLGLLLMLVILGGIGYAIYAGLHGRTQAETKLASATQAAATPSVMVVHPKPNSTTSDISLPGNTQAFTDAPIYARASGYLKSWTSDIGARVKQGQLLATLETPELDQQLQQAQANLADTQANLEISRTTNKRYQDLLGSHSVSQQEAAQTASDLASKQALVDAAAANVRRLQQTQAFQKIYAPFDGVITARNIDIGDLIQSGDTATPRELFHLAAINKLRVYIAVPEVYAPTVKDGEQVTLTLDSFPGETFRGTVVRNADAIDLATRTLNVEVDVDNQDGRLLPGAYAFVHLPVHAQAGTVIIPSDTLLFRAEGLRVGVVRDGKVVLQPITIGHDYGTTVEVTSGLKTDDAIILDPPDSLAEGETVQVTAPSAAAAAAK